MEKSYRVGKILKKLTGLKFVGQKNKPNLSENGKRRSHDYYASNASISVIQAEEDKSEENSEKKKYIQFQREVEATKVHKSDFKPEKPGKILKLPENRWEKNE